MKADYCKDMQKQYLILQQTEDADEEQKRATDFSVKMLLNNEIRGVLTFELRMIDNAAHYYYDITGRQSLKQLSEGRALSYRTISRVLEQLLYTARSSGEYFLNPDDFVFGEEFIFLSAASEEVMLVHAPGYATDARKQLGSLAEFLMEKLDYKEEAAVLLVYQFHKACTEPDCTFRELLEVIEERKQQISRQQKGENEKRQRQPEEKPEPEAEKRREQAWEQLEEKTRQKAQERKKSVWEQTEAEKKTKQQEEQTEKKWEPSDAEKSKQLKGAKQKEREKREKSWREEGEQAAQKAVAGHRLLLCACIFAMSQIVGVFLYQKGYFVSFVTEKWNLKIIGIYSVLAGAMFVVLIRELVRFLRLQKQEELELDKTVCVRLPQEPEMPQRQESIYGYLIPEQAEQEKEICIRELPCFIGKSRQNNMGICENRAVSRYHARIDRIEGSFYVTDLHSTNGTFINQREIPTDERCEIKDRDTISFANVSYRLHLCKS